jgi:large subunit ribosomal protein L11
MGNMEVQLLCEGGKASGGPPLGPAIGPTGVPIKSVVDAINEKTKEFKGLKVPVVVIVDTETKKFEIKISTPMASALLFKETGTAKGSGKAGDTVAADIPFSTVVKVAKMKRDALNALDMKGAVKTIVGTALSCGFKIDGKTPKQVLQDIDDGKYNSEMEG